MFGNWVEKNHDFFYFIFRVFAGLLFFQHGAQKLFGWFGGPKVELFSLMGLAGIIETFGSLAIAIGLFTRIMALIAAIEMLAAYFMAHVPTGLIPISNGGELALLYFAAFLIIMVHGAKICGIETAIFKKEFF
ncbi:DoxX family protein [Candidatus Woesearchaeota archaeon]|nr:DoxX family protein [Candidatus Woesearchaeota archaeon]